MRFHSKEVKQKENQNLIFNWPIGKAGQITKIAQIIDIAEELMLHLWIIDCWNWAVLVKSVGVAKKSGKINK